MGGSSDYINCGSRGYIDSGSSGYIGSVSSSNLVGGSSGYIVDRSSGYIVGGSIRYIVGGSSGYLVDGSSDCIVGGSKGHLICGSSDYMVSRPVTKLAGQVSLLLFLCYPPTQVQTLSVCCKIDDAPFDGCGQIEQRVVTKSCPIRAYCLLPVIGHKHLQSSLNNVVMLHFELIRNDMY